MIVVLMKGATKRVVVSPKAKGWVVEGDKHWPIIELASEKAFIDKWKALNKQGYKDTEYISSPPKKKPAKPQRYTVKVKDVKSPLFKAFAAWAKGQTYGAVGYFDVITGKLPKQLTDDAELRKTGASLLHLPDGSVVATNSAGQVLFLDSEGGKPKRLADDVRGFLTKLAKGKTGASDLDDKDATGRKAFAAWLAEQK